MIPTLALIGSEAEILAQVQPLFEQIMAAHEEADYSKIEPLLSEEMRLAFDEATFESIVADHLAGLGDLADTTWLGSLQKADATQALWKARYSRAPSEVLWQVFLAQKDERVEVVGLLFS